MQPQTYIIRDLTPADYPACAEMVKEELYRSLFVNMEISELHTKCAYASVACTKENEVVSFLITCHQPQYFDGMESSCQPASPPRTLCPPHYNDYLDKHYQLQANEFLTQFVRLSGCLPQHSRSFGFLLQSYFNFDPKHELLLFVLYPYCTLPQFLSQTFPELERSNQLPSSACYVHACPRAHILSPLKVEPAQMKDNDDVVLIFDAQNAQLKKRFENEFFIADMIKSAIDSEDRLAVLGSDFEVNSTEIYTPVSFLYVEKQQPFDDNFGMVLSNLKVTHQLDRYGLDQIAPDKIGYIRAMACLPQAESRSGDLIAYVFERWDVEILFLSMPSSASTDMQMIRLFTLVDPQSPLSPRESLFVCHRDSWLGSVRVIPINDSRYLDTMRQYIKDSLKGPDKQINTACKYPVIEHQISTAPNNDSQKINLRLENQLNENKDLIHNKIQVLGPDAEYGTIVAHGYVGQKVTPIAIGLIDLRVGRLNDSIVLKEYITSYENLSLRVGESRIQKGDFSVQQVLDNIKDKTENYDVLQQTGSIYEPATILQCRTWCKIHYDEDLSKFGFLKLLLIDPLFLQFRDDIVSSFMLRSGVEGFLLQVGHKMQQFIKPVYQNGQFNHDVTCDPCQILSPFEKGLFKSADYLEKMNLLRNPSKSYYDGQFGASYGNSKKVEDQVPSYQNSMYNADSELHQNRILDGQTFNAKAHRDFEQDVMLSAIRSLNPQFGLYVLRPQNCLCAYKPPVFIANPEDSQTIIVKPPTVFTDRLVILGFGTGLLATLQTLQQSHHLARFKTVTVVHPPPGPIYPFNFDKAFEFQQIYDHGESLPGYQERAVNLFYDVLIGDVNEVLIQQGILKLASGVEVGFDMLMICPDGADSESLRQIPNYNYNYSVSYNYGIVDPSIQQAQGGAAQPPLINADLRSKINDRGYGDPEIFMPLIEMKNYCQFLSSLYTEKLYSSNTQSQTNMGNTSDVNLIMGQKIPQRFQVHTEQQLNFMEIIKQRLHARTFFKFLTRDNPLKKRQVAAIHCSTYLENFNTCVSQLYSPQRLKLMKQEQKAKEQASEQTGPSTENVVDEAGARQQPTDAEQQQTAQTAGYKFLSPSARTSQFIQIMNPEVQAELPILLKRIAQVVMEARKQLFPSLYNPRPPKSGESIQTAVCSIVDVSRTSVGVIGDTFESLAIVQGLLDAGVPADSIILLLPQDPNADVDPLIQKQDNLIEHMLQPGGFCRTKPRDNCVIPSVLAQISKDKGKDDTVVDSKSTSQTAEKRNESFPSHLQQNILFSLQKLGVNVLNNVKISDVIATQTQSKSKSEGNTGEDGQTQDQAAADNTSDQGEEDDDEEEEMDDDQGMDDDTENKEITTQMISDACETLNQLNEADIVLSRKKGEDIGTEPEILNQVIDYILMGKSTEVISRNFDNTIEQAVEMLSKKEGQQELEKLIRSQIYCLAQQVSKTMKRKRIKKYRKIGNGEAFCGLKLKVLKNNQTEFDNKANIQPNKNRYVIGPPPNCVTMQIQINQNDQSTLQNQGAGSGQIQQLDIYICALFMTESFNVPNNLSYALMRSDLVFDKALIVNSYGQTSNQHVYASGNIGKLSRATLLKKLQQGFDHSQDIPLLPLSPVLLTQDPVKPVVTWSLYSSHETAEYATYHCLKNRLQVQEDHPYLIPEFTRPMILSAKVTGGFVFRVSRPLRDIRDQRFTQQKLFRSIETGDCPPKSGERWCRMEIDPLGIVDCFCIYGAEELPSDYKELVYRCVGLPISLFNQVEQRRQKGQHIPDLLDFLCQYQIQVLFDDNIITELNKILTDIITATKFQNQIDSVHKLVEDTTVSLADLRGEAVTADAGLKVIKSADNWNTIRHMLVTTAQEISTRVSERFYELGRDIDVRGKVTFKDAP